LSLEELPSRCPLIPEATQFPTELRHLIYHSHRIIFLSDPAGWWEAKDTSDKLASEIQKKLKAGSTNILKTV